MKEDIEEKLAVRNFARENMGETEKSKGWKLETKKKSPSISEIELSDLKIRIGRIQNFAIQSNYWELKSNRRFFGPIIIFVKRTIRKINHIILGWYINTLLEHQTCYNQANVAAIKNVDRLLELQQSGYESLLEQLNSQKIEIKELKEAMQIQRDEYLIMFRYYNKN